MKNFQNTQTKAKSTDLKSPVSKKFYTYISERVTAACAMAAHSEAMAAACMDAIDSYLADGTEPGRDVPPTVLLIFTLLRPEIDRAAKRSEAARLRAARRNQSSSPTLPLSRSERRRRMHDELRRQRKENAKNRRHLSVRENGRKGVADKSVSRTTPTAAESCRGGQEGSGSGEINICGASARRRE